MKRSCFIIMSSVCVWRADFISSFSPHKQVPVTWNLFSFPEGTRKHYRFNIWDHMSLYCFQMHLLRFFPSIVDSLFHHTYCLEEREFHIPISFLKPLLNLYQFHNTNCQHYFILCFKLAHHKCGLRQVLSIDHSGTVSVNGRNRKYKQRWS